MQIHRKISFIVCMLFSTHISLFNMSLNEDTWIYIFNLLPTQHQLKLTLTCKTLKNLFDTRVYIDECAICTKKSFLEEAHQKLKQVFTQAQKIDPIDTLCIKIQNNMIRGIILFNKLNDDQFKKIFTHLSHNRSITALDFTNCKVNNSTMSSLAPVLLQRSISLKKLILAGNPVGYNTIYELVKAASILEELDCRETAITVLNNCKKRKHLIEIDTGIIQNTHQPCSIQLVSNDHLSQLAHNFLNLKKLSLSECRLTWHRSDWLIEFLKTSTCLTTLVLQKNYLTNDSQKHLELRKAADIHTHSLTLLDISQQCEDRFVDAIIPYEPTRTNLQILL